MHLIWGVHLRLVVLHSVKYSMMSWLKRVFQESLSRILNLKWPWTRNNHPHVLFTSMLCISKNLHWVSTSYLNGPKNIHDITGPVFYSISRHQLHICSAKMTLCIFSTNTAWYVQTNSSELHKCSKLWIWMRAFATVNIFSSSVSAWKYQSVDRKSGKICSRSNGYELCM